MDHNTLVQQFDKMEAQIEALITRVVSVQAENKDLMDRIAFLEKNMAEKEDAARLFRTEKALIREKIDGLLTKLGDFKNA